MPIRRTRLPVLAVLCASVMGVFPIACSNPENEVDSSFRVQMSRTFCYGTCPVYTVSVNAQGQVNYLGEKWVQESGNHSWQISPQRVEELKAAVADARFMSITQAEIDECPSTRTDHSTVHFEIQIGETTNTIRHYTGCYGLEVYGKLTQLSRQVDRTLHTAAMVKIDWQSEPWKSEREAKQWRSIIDDSWVIEFTPLEEGESEFASNPPSFEYKDKLHEAGGVMESDGRLLVLIAPWGDEPVGGLTSKWPRILEWAEENGLESIRVWHDGAIYETVEGEFDYSKPISLHQFLEKYETTY
jgi:hypothetical protein